MQAMEQAVRDVWLMRLELRVIGYGFTNQVREHISRPLHRRSSRMDVLFRVRGGTWK